MLSPAISADALFIPLKKLCDSLGAVIGTAESVPALVKLTSCHTAVHITTPVAEK